MKLSKKPTPFKRILLKMVFIALLGMSKLAYAEPMKRPDQLPVSILNPTSGAKVELGRLLFFDARLSGNNSQACASCHQPDKGWSDGRVFSLGAEGGQRNRHTPSLYDLAWARNFAWDGRVESLEGFVLGPVMHPGEMNQDPDQLLVELSSDPLIVGKFAEAFGEARVTLDGISLSIAAFVKTIRSGMSPFDHWRAGDPDAIGAEAIKGFELFTGKAGCAQCHMGWRFTDDQLHDTGLPEEGTEQQAGASGKSGPAFKTPGLRNLLFSAPYMHDGSLPDLQAVLDHYVNFNTKRDTDIKKIRLNETEKLNLIAFLETLTEE